jgi:segregation and condensation protein A
VTAQHQSGEFEPCLVSLDVFEGPLDLLLHLIKKHELDIFDIPISFITDRYLEYVASMQELQLDIAAEYLEMAATLAHIKSQMLLPEEPGARDEAGEEEGPDPREELIRRLLEYKKYKEAARELSQRFLLGRHTFTVGADLPEPESRVVSEVTVFDLLDTVQSLIDKARAQGREGRQLLADRITVADRITQIADQLQAREKLSFQSLLGEDYTVFDVVITFLAVLEMVRLHMISAVQGESHGEILLAQPVTYEPRVEPVQASLPIPEPAPGEPPPPPEGEPPAPVEGGEQEPPAAAAPEPGIAGELNDLLTDFLKEKDGEGS